MPKPKFPRPLSLTLLLLTIALAYLSRSHPLHFYPWDKSLGDALYALAAYLFLLLLTPNLRPLPAFLLATTFCLLIEAFKLTGLPSNWAQTSQPLPALASRLLLGTTPSLHNLLCYLLATTLAVTLHHLYARHTTPQKR